MYSGFRYKRFSTAFAHFRHLVFEIVGFIAPMSLILDGWFTTHFEGNYMEKTKTGETFSTNKWFRNYG